MDDGIDYGALFGVTPDEDPESGLPAGQEQDGQGVGSNTSTSEAEGQEPAASEGAGQVQEVQENPDGAESQEPASQQQAGGTEPPPDGKTAERPADYQAAYEAAAAKAQADAQRTIDEAFARSGLRNPYTGQPITTKAEYDAYLERFESERREKILKQTGMSGEEFQQFVQGLPEVRKAREAQQAAEKAVREAQEAAARVKIEEQVKEIGQMDPTIQSLEDLAKMPTYPKFYELVKRGNTLTDAFRLANFEALTQNAAAGARQAAVNAARSKEHLEPTRSRGKGGISVPAEVKEQYRLFNPGITDEEIQKHYARSHKKED